MRKQKACIESVSYFSSTEVRDSRKELKACGSPSVHEEWREMLSAMQANLHRKTSGAEAVLLQHWAYGNVRHFLGTCHIPVVNTQLGFLRQSYYPDPHHVSAEGFSSKKIKQGVEPGTDIRTGWHFRPPQGTVVRDCKLCLGFLPSSSHS